MTMVGRTLGRMEATALPHGGNGGTTVELLGLSRAYGSLRALDGLDLRLEPGELVALLGPSGCGKTTALRIVAGFEAPDTGRVLLDGDDTVALPPQRRNMGMVFQGYSLFPTMTAEDNVAFGLRLRKVSRTERRRRARELLELVGLEHHGAHFPHQLSGGQQQRVALARALAVEPRVLLLDEPLSALDAKVRVQLREHIRALQQRVGITTLFVTHDQEEALSMADRVGVMRAGRLEQIAPPPELYANPATAFVAQFVGTMNRVPVARRGDHVHLLGRRARVRPGSTVAGSAPAVALVRPEGLALTPDRHGEGIVTAMTFLGYVTRLEILVSAELALKVDRPSVETGGIAVGDAVRVELVDDDVLLTAAD